MKKFLKKTYKTLRWNGHLIVIWQVHGYFRSISPKRLLKKCQMQQSTKAIDVCTREHKQSDSVNRNKNNDTAMLAKIKRMLNDYMKRYMQQR